MSLQSVNLNLLPLMQALFKYRSVTLAARSLGVSQSAASQSLARLRLQMNDPLLVRIGGRMHLTPLARQLMSRVAHVTAELDDLFLPSRFDPATEQRIFVIAANDYQVYLIGRSMLDLQRAAAPGIRIHFIEIGPNCTERMAAQEIDFALLPRFAVRDLTLAPLRYRSLRTDSVVVLMDRAHPLATRSMLDEADLMELEFVAFHAEALELVPLNNWEASAEIAPLWDVMRKVAIRTNHFMLIPELLRDTNLVSIVPRSLGEALSRAWPVVNRPISFGGSVELGIAWSPVFDADPAHAWLRTQIENRSKEWQAS